MPHATLRIIRDEHAALSAMLQSILMLLAQHRRQGSLPDFAALRAMLFYVDEFPEKRHHHKESELLFPKLRARTPLSRELLDELDADLPRASARFAISNTRCWASRSWVKTAARPLSRRRRNTSSSTWPTWHKRSGRSCRWPCVC